MLTACDSIVWNRHCGRVGMPSGTDQPLAAFLKAMRELVSPTRESKDGPRRGRVKTWTLTTSWVQNVRCAQHGIGCGAIRRGTRFRRRERTALTLYSGSWPIRSIARRYFATRWTSRSDGVLMRERSQLSCRSASLTLRPIGLAAARLIKAS